MTSGKKDEQKQTLPPQHQDEQPGIESQMRPRPRSFADGYRAAGRLKDKVALVTGGDSGIGRAAAIAFAKEGADVAIAYLDETGDAIETRQAIEREGRRCIAIACDLRDEQCCTRLVEDVVAQLGRLDIVVNNAAEQHPQEGLEQVTGEQLRRTFETNVFSMFYVTRSALAHLGRDGRIINTTSVTAYRGSPKLIDYASTKGAIVAFTRSLAINLADRGIRVNAVAPGPVWTPLIPASFDEEKVASFGSNVPLGRPGQPDEIAPCFVFLAAEGADYMTGQVLHPNGGEIVNA